MRGALWRWLTVVLAAVVLSWSTVVAFGAARTGGTVFDGLQFLRIWHGQATPPLDVWTSMWERLQAARAIEPDNPQTQETLGLMAARRVDDFQLLQQASKYFERALVLRPVSANTWANLASARYLVGDTGPIFVLAIENAAKLGPSQPQAQRLVAHYGLAVYSEVPRATRSAIETMVAAGMRRDPGEMLAIAAQRGRLDVACRYLPERTDPRWRQACATERK